MNAGTTSTSNKDIYTLITNRIISLLEEGVIPWKQPWTEAGIPMNLISKKPYRGINHLLLLPLKYEKLLFLTWKQVQSLGAMVRRGEHGYPIVFYKKLTVADQEGVEKTIPLLRYHTVFNIEQCNNIPERVLASYTDTDNNIILSCEDIVQNMSNRPDIKHCYPGAFYEPLEDLINVPKLKSFHSSEAYYSCLFHEMIHATGHSSRLNRKSLTRPSEHGSAIYSLEELVAEIGAAYLANLSGIEPQTIDSSAAYIRGWLIRLNDDPRFFIYASNLAQKAVDYILHNPHEYE